VDTVRILLPVVWTAVAAGVGLLLYRYSKAKVEQSGVALGGAAAIAAVTFYGLYIATPKSVLFPYETRLLTLTSDQQAQIVGALTLCVDETKNEKACHDSLLAVQSTSLQIGGMVKKIVGGE
jgi:hypothetical protein